MKWSEDNLDWIVLFFVALLVFGIVSLSGNLLAGPRIVDDNQIFRLQQELSKSSFLDVAQNEINTRLWHFRRLVPLFCIHKVAEAKLFGGNLLAWSVYTSLLGVLTVFFLFRFGRIIGFSIIESIFLALLSLLGSQSALWWKLIHGEGLAMLCLSISLMCMGSSVKSKDDRILHEILFVSFAILASLSKESFVLILPALIFWQILFRSEDYGISLRASVKGNILPIAVLLAVFAGELLFILFFLGKARVTTYAGWDGFDFENFMQASRQFFQIAGLWILLLPFILVVCLIIYQSINSRDKKQIHGTYLKGLFLHLFLFFLILFPQLLLHMKSGFVRKNDTDIIFSRYLLPSMVGYAYIVVYLLRYLRVTLKKKASGPMNVSGRLGMILVLSAIVVHLGTRTGIAYNEASSYARYSHTINKWLNDIKLNTKESDNIMIVYDPVRHYRYTFRLRYILNGMLDRHNIYYYPVSLKPPDYKWGKEEIKEIMESHLRNAIKIRESDEIDALLILGKEAEEKFLDNSEGLINPAQFEGYVSVVSIGYLEEKELSEKWNRSARETLNGSNLP